MSNNTFTEILEQYLICHRPFIKSKRANLLQDKCIRYRFNDGIIYVIDSASQIVRFINPANIDEQIIDHSHYNLGDIYTDYFSLINNFDVFILPKNDYYIGFDTYPKSICYYKEGVKTGHMYHYDDLGTIRQVFTLEFDSVRGIVDIYDDIFKCFDTAVHYIQELDSNRNDDVIKAA